MQVSDLSTALPDPTDEPRMPNGQLWPRITIVTPSFNQGQFIEETILSVIGQRYPNLEYIVMDGGSSDNTVEIIKKYEKHISHWQSEKDGGQSAAINAGFGRATGDIVAWLNSDDFYLPGTLHYVATQLDTSKSEILLGNCFHFFQNSATALGSDVVDNHEKVNLLLCDYVIQPSSFWTRNTWQQVGELNQDLHYAFDWEWYIRCHNASIDFKTCHRYFSAYRFHEDHKTGTGGSKRREEISSIYQIYSGENYKELFLKIHRSKEKFYKFQGAIKRLKLSKIEKPLMKLIFPKFLKNNSAEEVEQILLMCSG